MHTLYGKILDVDTRKRTIAIVYKGKKHTLYFQRSLFNTYLPFLKENHFAVLKVEDARVRRGVKQSTVREIVKLIQAIGGKRRVLFSIRNLRRDMREFVRNLGKKLYLDFEMTMHPYRPDKFFTQEIIQMGYILVDEKGEVLKRFEGYIRPTKHKKLTKRTLKFLKINQADVDQGVDFNTFYEHLKAIIMTHDPAIIVWGKNDYLALNDAYRLNNVPSLAQESRFVNLLELHKIYFRYKNDLGLKNAFTMYGNTLEEQRHDAYEDAWMTKKVFEGFKRTILKDADHSD
ncbi:MAG: exonuclease domain-containing protein [Bacillota bacterium]